MTPSEEPGWLKEAFVALSAAVSFLATWAWKHTHKRIDEKVSHEVFIQHQKSDEQQLEKISAEIAIQRQHTTKLFEKLEDLSDQTSVKFTVLERLSTDRHIELLNAINNQRRD